MGYKTKGKNYMTITTFEQVLTLPKYDKIKAKIIYKNGETSDSKISNEGKSLFIYAKGKKRFGLRFYDFAQFSSIEIKENKPENKAEKWLKSWTRVKNILEISGLWQDLLKDVKTALDIGYDKIQLASKQDGVDNTDENKKELEYGENNRINAEKIKEIDKRLIGYNDKNEIYALSSILWYMVYPARIKKMYFGKNKNSEILLEIANALKNNVEMSTGNDGNSYNGQSYDTTFSYNPKSKKAWYSEQYRNCGNGHYYLALNSTHALFYEDD